MYMYYFLTQRLLKEIKEEQGEMKARRRTLGIEEQTFILALDGDVDFQPSALKLLMDRMKRNENVGAACGRIHPIGVGNEMTAVIVQSVYYMV